MVTEPFTLPPVSGPYSNSWLIVVGASGSSRSITSSHAPCPRSAPSWACSWASRFELAASPPPPAPKIEPMKAVVAKTSLTVAGSSSMLLACQ